MRLGRRQRGELTAEAHAQIRAPPEEVRQATAGRKVAVEPGNVSDGAVTADVGHRALVRVVEGLDVLDAAQLLLQALELSGHDRRVRARDVQRRGQLVDAVLEELGLGHGVEQARKEGALLRRDLGRGRVAGDGAVTRRPDVGRALHHQVFVHGEAAARVLLRWDLRHEVSHEGADGIAGGPDEEAVWQDLSGLLAVWTGGLGLDGVFGDPLDGGLGHDSDFLLLER